MKNNTKIASLFIGALLLVSAIFSVALSKHIIQILLLTILGVVAFVFAFTKKEKTEMFNEAKLIKKNPALLISATLLAVVFSGGVGFIFGKLLYQFVH